MADQVTRTDYAADLIAALRSRKLKLGYPAELDKWIAMRESQRDRLRTFANWDPKGTGRPYKIDPLPEKISTAFADFLWGEDPTIEPFDENDADALEAIVNENDLSAELHHAEEIKSSEGQVWWRIYRDDEQSFYPIIEWHSRTEVIPYFRGKRLLAVAFISHVEDSITGEGENAVKQVWRRLEVYGPGVTYNVLFVSSDPNQLGDEVPLTQHADTAEFMPEWRHGLDMLAGYIPNRRGNKRSHGRSDYHGVEDLLFDLNEAHTVDSENFRLAGKKRAVMPRKYAGQQGEVDPGEEIFFSESLDELDPDNTFKILEYDYDGESSKVRKDDLTGTVLTRVGLARQFVDANANEGTAGESGTALRTRLIPTTLTARGKARPWDEEAPTVLRLAQQVDALTPAANGFGRPWTAPDEAPAVERGSILPEDEQEKLDWHVAAYGADLESRETALKDLHPDWSDEQIREEIDRIKAENNEAFGGGDVTPPDDATDPNIDPETGLPFGEAG
jgi:hypothetical protein